MIHFFNPENKFWCFIAKLADAFLMGMLWLVVSLPVITVGAATTAFYDFTIRQIGDTEGSLVKSFFRSFRSHFKKATALWLIQLAGTAFFAADLFAAFRYYQSGGGIPSILVMSCCIAAAVIFWGGAFYVYPTLAVFDFPLKKLLHDAFIMAVGNLPVTVTLYVLFGLSLVGFYYASGLVFVWAALFVFLSSYPIFGVFAKYTGLTDEDDSSETDGDAS